MTTAPAPPAQQFIDETAIQIRAQGNDAALADASLDWMLKAAKHKYTYHYTWLGRPVIQYPQDMLALQEIIWATKPDLIIETGIAHGGSLIFSASMLELLSKPGLVLGIDIDIRPHNRAAIENHPMHKRIRMIEGSSIDPCVVDEVTRLAAQHDRVMVILDSDHSHDHVLAELRAYAPLVTNSNYLIVYDTIIEDLPPHSIPGRPWTRGDNPKTAVYAYLNESDRFEIDHAMHEKLLITNAPDGYLRCIRD